MKVEFHPEAEEEFAEAALYYEKRVPSLGDVFLANLNAATRLLAKNGEIGTKINSGFRYYPMHKFPYSIIYVNEQKRI